MAHEGHRAHADAQMWPVFGSKLVSFADRCGVDADMAQAGICPCNT